VKTNSQTVLCALNELAQEGDILATLVNEEYEDYPISRKKWHYWCSYQYLTEEAGEIIQFKLIKK
jgi:hypothetical protein